MCVYVGVVLVVQVFERILYIWAIRHPASGYVQGINDLVTPFFVVFLAEYLADGQSNTASSFYNLTLTESSSGSSVSSSSCVLEWQ